MSKDKLNQFRKELAALIEKHNVEMSLSTGGYYGSFATLYIESKDSNELFDIDLSDGRLSLDGDEFLELLKPNSDE